MNRFFLRTSPDGERSIRPSQAGFTLIEVMLAVALLGIGALSATLAHLTAQRANMQARAFGASVPVIADWTERLQGMARDEIPGDFPAFPPCAGLGSDIQVLATGDISKPDGAGSLKKVLVDPQSVQDITPAPNGRGVVVAYNLYAYCPPSRRVAGPANNRMPNSYRIEGNAFLVEEVNPGGEPFRVISYHPINIMVMDRCVEGAGC